MSTEQPINPYAANNSNKASGFQGSKNNGLAIASLILGVLSIFLYFVTAIPGIITGHMARSRAKKQPELYTGSGMALGGLILSYIMLMVSVFVVVGMIYLFKNNPEFKDIFTEAFNEEMSKSLQKQ